MTAPPAAPEPGPAVAAGYRRRAAVLFPAVNARAGGIATAAVLAVLGAVLLWQAGDLDAGRPGLPGPGFLPRVLSVVLIGLAAVTGAREWRRRDRADGGTAADGAAPGAVATVAFGHRDVVAALAAMVAVPALFEPLGAYVTLGLLVAVLLVVLARTAVVVAVAAAVIAMAACWFFFAVLLGLTLPLGVLEGVLP